MGLNGLFCRIWSKAWPNCITSIAARGSVSLTMCNHQSNGVYSHIEKQHGVAKDRDHGVFLHSKPEGQSIGISVSYPWTHHRGSQQTHVRALALHLPNLGVALGCVWRTWVGYLSAYNYRRHLAWWCTLHWLEKLLLEQPCWTNYFKPHLFKQLHKLCNTFT